MSLPAESDSGTLGLNGRAERPSSWIRVGAGARLGVLACLVAGLGLLAAGCGGTQAPSVASLGTTSTSTSMSTGTTGGGGGGAAIGGSGPATSSSGGSGNSAQMTMAGGSVQQMTKFAACMRQHGEPSFPDPNAQGQISISSSAGIDPGSVQFQQAQQACQKDMPNKGAPPSPAQQAQMRSQALAFSACMRSHGEPNFPDPQFGTGGRVAIKISAGAGIDPQSPQFQAAQKACQSIMGGPKGGPPSPAAAGGGSGSESGAAVASP